MNLSRAYGDQTRLEHIELKVVNASMWDFQLNVGLLS